MSSSMYLAIKQILTAFGCDSDGQAKAFSYKTGDDFEALWQMVEAGAASYKRLVVIWDGMPKRNARDVVDTGRYLTPIDWVIALSLSIQNKIKSTTPALYPDLKIYIIDAGEASASTADSMKFVQMFDGWKIKSIPWLRIYHPEATGQWFSLPDFLPSVCSSESEADDMLSMMKAAAKKPLDLELIRGTWAAFLTSSSNSSDNHALANIIGPLLLMHGEQGDCHVTALRSLMKSISLLPDVNDDGTLDGKKSWVTELMPTIQEIVAEAESKIHITLIDDQHEAGWGKMICRAFGVTFEPAKDNIIGQNNQVVIKAYDNPTSITIGRKPFALQIGNSNSVVPEILFLDLRLYSGRSIEEEAKLFGVLVSVARGNNLIEAEEDRLPWPGFKEEEELGKIDKWIKNKKNKSREDSEYILALTLLPRIVALTDLSFPIILFSSTGRREITDQFDDYGNIITDFAKPRFTVDLPVDIAKQSMSRFQDAVSKALQILKGRIKCQKIIQKSVFSNIIPIVNTTNSEKCFHVELYIDESFKITSESLNALPSKLTIPLSLGNKISFNTTERMLICDGKMKPKEKDELLRLSGDHIWKQAVNNLFTRSWLDDEIHIGGLIAVFEGATIEEAQKKADSYDDELVNAGIRYFDGMGIGASPSSKTIKDKKQSSLPELQQILQSKSSNAPAHLIFTKLDCLSPKDGGESLYFSPDSGDNLFRMTLAALLELFLAESIPVLFPEKKKDGLSIAVYAGTRLKPYTNLEKKDLVALKFHLGFDHVTYPDRNNPKIKKNYLKSMNRDSIFPIVLDILSYHNIERNMYRVVGIALQYESKQDLPNHFICRTCREIVLINRSADIAFGKTIKQRVLACDCGSTNKFVPDYRALHYIADEILNHVADVYAKTGYGELIDVSPFGFDDKLQEIAGTLAASRALDMNDIVTAIADVPVDKVGEYGITRFLLKRLADRLHDIKGADFCKAASKIGRTEDIITHQFSRYLKKNLSGGIFAKKREIKIPEGKKELIVKQTTPHILCLCDNLFEVKISNSEKLKSKLNNIKAGDKLYARIEKQTKLNHIKPSDKLYASIQQQTNDYYAREIEIVK